MARITERTLPQCSDEELLATPMRELPLRLDRTPLVERIDRLFAELAGRGLRFRPSVWLADEWFSPDSLPGIAIPFYLAHPRLVALERRMMGRAEGATQHECMRILRHEAGHAIDTAYLLRRKKQWQELFGLFTSPYPRWYRPDPKSRDYVIHLDGWYAQAHPAEDFAETFAVWLAPRSGWRTRYRGWGALEKLEYVDSLMESLAGTRPINWRKGTVDPLSSITRTLGEHYEARRRHYQVPWSERYDRALQRVFPRTAAKGTKSAVSFLFHHRRELRDAVSHEADAMPYSVDHALQLMMLRCSQLKLAQGATDTFTKQQAISVLRAQVSRFVHVVHRRIAL